MLRQTIRIKNFKCLKDTKKLDIRPITFLVGPNSSGKSSLIQALLALKQTHDNKRQPTSLILQDYIDLGSYNDMIFRHKVNNNFKITIRIDKNHEYSYEYSIKKRGKEKGKIFLKKSIIPRTPTKR